MVKAKRGSIVNIGAQAAMRGSLYVFIHRSQCCYENHGESLGRSK